MPVDLALEGPAESETKLGKALTKAARALLAAVGKKRRELSLVLTDDASIRVLNRDWRGEDKATDVLSFPMDELRPGREGDVTPAGLLGDVVLCPEVAAQQAKVAGHSTIEEMLLLTTHGILHLLGYDHAEPEEEKEMFALQRKLLLTFLASR